MIRRLLMRRGVYTGMYTSWHPADGVYPPRPAVYFVVNHKDSGMVRLEAGLGSRSFWLDWGQATP